MQTLILPGYSSKNKAWADSIKDHLLVEGMIRPIYWAHWNDESIVFDAKEKADLLVKHTKGDNINIIAKSVGTLVSAYMFNLMRERINKIILCGIPVNDLNELDLELVRGFAKEASGRILIIQNIHDPHGNYELVKNFGNVVSKDRNDHDYPYLDDFNNFLTH